MYKKSIKRETKVRNKEVTHQNDVEWNRIGLNSSDQNRMNRIEQGERGFIDRAAQNKKIK